MKEIDRDKKLALAVHNSFLKHGEYGAVVDEYDILKHIGGEWAHKESALLRKDIIDKMRLKQEVDLFKSLRMSLMFDATVDFDCYMRAMEWERDPQKRFYQPRRKIIKPMWVDPIQDLLDDKLDLLTLSCPPGTGKSTLGVFLLSFVMGQTPDMPSLASAHSGTLTDSFYRAVLSLITDEEYTFKEIFPIELADKNGMLQTIDLGKAHRFSTLTCRAINASLTGATRCERILYADDMCSGIEEATNPDRLNNLWQKYTNDLKSRKKEKCKEIHIATRWSINDLIGRLQRLYDGDERCKFILCPALDENDKSNFDYDYDVGFSTKYFIDMRANLDPMSWSALFMNEPVEREGVLFDKDELRYFSELPKDDKGEILQPDAILAVADTKDRGVDYGVMPCVYMYGNDLYLEDVVCNNGKPEIVEAEFASLLLKHRVKACRFESNSAGGKIAQSVDREVKAMGGNTHITTKFTSSNKETRIQVCSAAIKNRVLFKSNFDKTSEYGLFMSMLVGYVLSGKNKHDDVPDALSMLIEFVEGLVTPKVEVFRRPF